MIIRRRSIVWRGRWSSNRKIKVAWVLGVLSLLIWFFLSNGDGVKKMVQIPFGSHVSNKFTILCLWMEKL